jgi:hypothetical protein
LMQAWSGEWLQLSSRVGFATAHGVCLLQRRILAQAVAHFQESSSRIFAGQKQGLAWGRKHLGALPEGVALRLY